MWNTIIIQPLTGVLHLFITITNDIGAAIILFTVLIKTLLLPLNISSTRTSKNIKKIQGHIETLKTKHKNNPRDLGLALNALYKENNIKPFSGILSLFIQIPILFGLYHILVTEIKTLTDTTAFGIIDITTPNYWLAALSFLSMLILMHISVKDMHVADNASDFQKEFTKMIGYQMKYFLPIVILITSIVLPAGLTIYFIVSNLFGIGQFYLMKRIIKD